MPAKGPALWLTIGAASGRCVGVTRDRIPRRRCQHVFPRGSVQHEPRLSAIDAAHAGHSLRAVSERPDPHRRHSPAPRAGQRARVSAPGPTRVHLCCRRNGCCCSSNGNGRGRRCHTAVLRATAANVHNGSGGNADNGSDDNDDNAAGGIRSGCGGQAQSGRPQQRQRRRRGQCAHAAHVGRCSTRPPW